MGLNLIEKFSEYDLRSVSEFHFSIFKQLKRLKKLERYRKNNEYIPSREDKHFKYLIELAKTRQAVEEMDYIFFEE